MGMTGATTLKIISHIVSPGAKRADGSRDWPTITVVTDGIDYGQQVRGDGAPHACVLLLYSSGPSSGDRAAA